MLADTVALGGWSGRRAVELPFTDCRLRFRASQSGRLPAFLGTTFRGALGYELRRTVCHVSRGECPTCLLRDTCVYRVLFLGHPPRERQIMRKYPAVPQPFVTAVAWRSGGPIREGESVAVGWRLFGPAIQHFPVLVHTLMEVGKRGLGPGRVPLTLALVDDHDGRPLYAEAQTTLAVPQVRSAVWPARPHIESDRLSLHFATPMRLRFREELCRRFHAEALLAALLRRLRILAYFYGDDAVERSALDEVYDAARAALSRHDETRWVEINRLSGRQDRRMLLGGFIGQAAVEVPSALARSLLEVGEVIHGGKATSFGFGRFEVKGDST